MGIRLFKIIRDYLDIRFFKIYGFNYFETFTITLIFLSIFVGGIVKGSVISIILSYPLLKR